MCALIYQKVAADKTLILNPREGVQRAFDFGTAWTELRMGFFLSFVTAAGDNTAPAANEAVVVSNVLDRIFVGLKNSDNAAVPGQASSLFIGLTNDAGSSKLDDLGGDRSCAYSEAGGTSLRARGYSGVTSVGADAAAIIGPISPRASVANATGYCGFYGIKFVITNRGLATQAVAVSVAQVTNVAGADYSANALLTKINNEPYVYGPGSIPWNTGAAAYNIPDAYYIRFPFYNNRARLSAVAIKRYA